MLCDWLVVNQVLPVNPAAAGRGPKHIVTQGSTRRSSRPRKRGSGTRALLSVMLYSFARVSAVLGMRRPDYEPWGGCGSTRRGGRRHDAPAHHPSGPKVLDAYLGRGRGADGGAFFQSVDRAGKSLTGRATTGQAARGHRRRIERIVTQHRGNLSAK